LEFLFGRSLLRHLLGVRTKTAPEQLTFGYGAWGKPYLKSPATAEHVQFNISHSNGQLILALCDNRRVGVDIERIRSEMDWLLVARQYFSPTEVDALLSFPPDLQAAAFFKVWTCKEAYLKATGLGLTGSLPDIEVILSPGREPELRTSQSAVGDDRKWKLQSLPLGKGYVGALVFEDSTQ
jgi:4'-phosphopantetheinyl transferase